MQYSYSQYADLEDAKTKIAANIDLYASLAIDATRFFTEITLTEQMERYKQAMEYLELMPATNEKYRLVEALALAKNISMLSAAVAIDINDTPFFDVEWPAIEGIRTRQKDALEALETPDTIADAVAIRLSALTELIEVYS